MWERVGKVSAFWKDGILDPETNVSFGEGGAGTFSDGKLNTGVKDKTGKKKFILDSFIQHGAPEEIGYLSKPHIGTDELRGVIQSMGETIRQLGGTYLFHTRLTGFRYVEEESGPGQKQLRAVVMKGERQKRFPVINVCLPSVTAPEIPFLCCVRMGQPWSRSPLQWGCGWSTRSRASIRCSTVWRIPGFRRRIIN